MPPALTLTFLGSGGNSPIPMPTCSCERCAEARERGLPYARHGNSMYLHELNAMIDAPEFVYGNIERHGVTELDYVFLTHWHPDHVNGLRVVQSRDFGAVARDHGGDGRGRMAAVLGGGPTIVTTERVYERTRDVLGSVEHFVEDVGFADLHLLDVDGPLEVNGARVTAVPYALRGDGDEDATGFVVTREDRALVVVSDDAKYLDESRLPRTPDVAVFECGVFEEDTGGERLFTDTELSVLADEPRHDEIVERARRVGAGRTFLTEIGHICARSYDDLRVLEREYEDDRIRFAFDGLTVEV